MTSKSWQLAASTRISFPIFFLFSHTGCMLPSSSNLVVQQVASYNHVYQNIARLCAQLHLNRDPGRERDSTTRPGSARRVWLLFRRWNRAPPHGVVRRELPDGAGASARVTECAQPCSAVAQRGAYPCGHGVLDRVRCEPVRPIVRFEGGVSVAVCMLAHAPRGLEDGLCPALAQRQRGGEVQLERKDRVLGDEVGEELGREAVRDRGGSRGRGVARHLHYLPLASSARELASITPPGRRMRTDSSSSSA